MSTLPLKALLSFVQYLRTWSTFLITQTQESGLDILRMEYPLRVGPPPGEVAPWVATTMKAMSPSSGIFIAASLAASQAMHSFLMSKRRWSCLLFSVVVSTLRELPFLVMYYITAVTDNLFIAEFVILDFAKKEFLHVLWFLQFSSPCAASAD